MLVVPPDLPAGSLMRGSRGFELLVLGAAAFFRPPASSRPPLLAPDGRVYLFPRPAWDVDPAFAAATGLAATGAAALAFGAGAGGGGFTTSLSCSKGNLGGLPAAYGLAASV